jgi:hypothetical protein
MADLFDQVLNAKCSIWKKATTGIADGYGIQSQNYILVKTDVPCRADPGDGKELDTEAAFGVQTYTFFMRPQMVDTPEEPLNIHHWLQVNQITSMTGVVTTYPLDPTVTPMHDIQNIKNPGQLNHHLEIQTRLIEP